MANDLMATLQRKLLSTDFAKNVAVLVSGTVAGRLILVLAMPILTRLYSPEGFELLAVFLSLSAIVTVVATMRLDLAVPLVKDDGDAINVLALALLFSGLISGVLLVIVLLWPQLLAGVVGNTGFMPYLWMVPVGIFFGSVYQSAQCWTSRQRRFPLVAKTRVQRAVGGTAVQVGMGLVGGALVPFGLLFGQVVYNALGVLGLFRDLFRNDRNLLSTISWGRMRHNLSVQRYFPIYSVPEALMNAAGMQIPILIIAATATGGEAGFLLLAIQMVTMPLALIGRSVGQVYLAEAAGRHRDGVLGAFTVSMAKKLFLYGTPPLVLLGILAPFVFGPIFGEGWERAGILVAWAIPWALFQFVSSPLSTSLHTMGRIKLAMVLQAFGLVLRVGVVLIAVAGFPTFLSEAYAVASALFYAVYILVILAVTR